LFYESASGGGRASVIAVGRVRSTEAHLKKEISSELFRHGVLDSDDLMTLTAADTIAVTTFDNVMPLDQPVSLDRLKKLGCVDDLNLVCARPLTHEQLRSIIEEGFPLG
jgi:hypothetical protein